MKAMIFAAGIGSRLKPFTDSHPKALAPVGGMPILGRVVTKLKYAGVDGIAINVHHFPQQIINYLKRNNNFGIDVHVSDESALLLDTGGGLAKAAEWLLDSDDPIIVHNADILTDFPITEMLHLHLTEHNDVTLLADQRATSRYLLFDKSGRMRGWTNVKTAQVRPESLQADALEPLAFGGVHILSHQALHQLSVFALPDMPFSIMDFYISKCQDITIRRYKPLAPYRWHDIGKPEALKAANLDFSNAN